MLHAGSSHRLHQRSYFCIKLLALFLLGGLLTLAFVLCCVILLGLQCDWMIDAKVAAEFKDLPQMLLAAQKYSSAHTSRISQCFCGKHAAAVPLGHRIPEGEGCAQQS